MTAGSTAGTTPGVPHRGRGRRLRRALAAVRLPAAAAAAEPVLLAGDSNDVWRLGPVVLRVCWRGDLDRFDREALLTAHLPPAVPHPPLLDTGGDDELRWQLTGYLPGATLAAAWPALDPPARRSAIHQLGTILAELNGHPFPAVVRDALGRPRRVIGADLDELLGTDVNPLPVARALRLAPAARAVPFVDPRLIDRARGRLAALESIDPFSTGEPGAVLHGDAHPGNVLWREGRIVALLDLEWARLGPVDLELQPFLEVDGDDEAAVHAARRTLRWLAESHPAAFGHPRLPERLTLYELAYTLRHILVWPPAGPEESLPWGHPVRRLRRLLDDPDHLGRLLPG